MDVEYGLGTLGKYPKEERERFYKERICVPTSTHDATRIPRVKAVEFYHSLEQYQRILDIACHDGFCSRWMADDDVVELVVGVDLCHAAIEAAKEASKESGQPEKLRYEECSWEEFFNRTGSRYNLILCFEFLEHIPREECIKLLRAIHAFLALDGRCLISTPEKNGYWGLRNDQEREHFNLMDSKELSQLIQDAIGITADIHHDLTSDLLMATWVKDSDLPNLDQAS